MKILAVVALGILPGAWIGFTKPARPLDTLTKLAISVALSPFVVSLQAVLLGVVGIPGRRAALTILLINLPAGFLLLSGIRKGGHRHDLQTLGLILGAAVVPVFWLLVVWMAIPGFRLFGWHNLLHVDIVYQLLRPPLMPEEPGLAAVSLSYAWLGHAFWAVTGLLADRPPTWVFPIGNIMMLLSVIALMYRAGRELTLCRPLAVLGAVLSVLGGHLVQGVTRLTMGNLSAELIGEKRLKLPLAKFLYADFMPVSLALLAAALLLTLLMIRRGERSLAIIVTLCLAALAGIYSLALPAAIAVVLSLAFFAIARSPEKWGHGLGRVGPLVGGVMLITLAFALWAISREGAAMARMLPLHVIPLRSWVAFIVVAPYLLVALPAAVRAFRQREPVVQGLMLAIIFLLGAYALFDVRDLQYKYIAYARPCLAMLVALTLQQWTRRWNRGRWVMMGAIIFLVGGLSLAAALAQIPRKALNGAPPVREDGFQITLAPGSPHAGWTSTVREETPPDTILVGRELPIHASVFANRSVYIPVERSGNHTAGYSLNHSVNLLQFRGYSPAVFKQRNEVVGRLYGASSSASFLDEIKTLRMLGRPLVLHFHSSMDLRLIHWLQQDTVGRLLVQDGDSMLWYVEGDS